jgi:hypothetical protein
MSDNERSGVSGATVAALVVVVLLAACFVGAYLAGRH